MAGVHIPENKWILAENIAKDIDHKDHNHTDFDIYFIEKKSKLIVDLRNSIKDTSLKIYKL